jgi:hypothetical protein
MVMIDPYSHNFNLLMLNTWLGLCKGVRGLPRDLRDAGYQDFLIEYRFVNSTGETVVPELIIISEKIAHTVLLEWKSGNNTKPDQLKRYMSVTKNDLITKAMVPQNACSRHDTCVVGKEEHADRLTMGLSREQCPFPLLAVGRRSMRLVLNSFQVQVMNQLFGSGLSIDMSRVPMSFVPFNLESDLWEVAEAVMPYVVAHMTQRQPRILLREACRGVVSGWETFSAELKPQFESRVKEVLTEAARREFHAHLSRNKTIESKTQTPTWDIRRNPLDYSSTKRSTEYKRLVKLQEGFLEALRTGRKALLQDDLFESSES